ncbi:hypothetical protein COV89_02025 [Candidatus Shapirobacteria bacterium CG11_big_fil_rev_8_21_14_0_20_40_12]|uniref:Type II toxin-antitoxin system HicA family toxin n=3 Tax=Candidatus Shapironibacteriota TaxID=1752721 RepID=A0A2M8EV34_9BACT|nr:MAG: hypothetical protein COV89_02025 [Candidatus Shapirobacteria bacterium CG11_big_fil_rev_8_21_14_0_20_40_12]PJC28991.1 MAG: hypothetical protein CO053_01685 [Candidatus Shapirobacteria bacterium CG_4_9_14_0_2_um_filter_40_11]PJC77671.1 MAG: hypothetical protein CO010_00050 [Candidatus Shapirobacteria bacterium CG_4_8_14_3_um_filter_39_11]
MMSLPSVKPKQALKTLVKFGFEIKRQTGSHIRLIHPDGRATTIAMHNRDLPKGTLRAILKQSGISFEEFLKNL